MKDRLVWIVEFKGFTPFVSGPLTGETWTPPPTNGHLLAAVDAASGEVVWGTQY